MAKDRAGKPPPGTDPGTDPTDILRSFEYIGRVHSMKRDYQVFRTPRDDFLVFSPSSRSPSSFHVTHVPRARVDALAGIVSEEVTTNSLLKDKRVAEAFRADKPASIRFEILMALYVMSALGSVEIGRSGRQLLFRPTRAASSEADSD